MFAKGTRGWTFHKPFIYTWWVKFMKTFESHNFFSFLIIAYANWTFDFVRTDISALLVRNRWSQVLGRLVNLRLLENTLRKRMNRLCLFYCFFKEWIHDKYVSSSLIVLAPLLVHLLKFLLESWILNIVLSISLYLSVTIRSG
jgi:hypothetical protein